MHSMTGCGSGKVQQDGWEVTVDLKTVNHRFLDIGMRLPRNLNFLEQTIRDGIGKRILRGHVDDRTNVKDLFFATNGVQGFKNSLEKTTGKKEIDGIAAFKLIKEEHDEAALAGVKEFCLDLAHHIYNLQAVIDAERVLIGGGISNEPMFIDLVREAVDQVFDHAIFQVIPKPDVMVCRFQADANLIGAVYNFIELQDLYEGNQFINI